MSMNPRRRELDFLLPCIDAILPNSSTVRTSTSAQPSAVPTDDAPAVFNADRISSNMRQRGGRGRRQANRGGRFNNSDSNKQGSSSLQALKDAWRFNGTDDAFKRYLSNRRPDGPIDKQYKKMQQELKELKSKRKLEHNEEADCADSSPSKAQRMCFHLESELTGQEAFLAFTHLGDMAEEASDVAQSSDEEQSSSSDDKDVLRSASERQHAVPNTKKMKPASSSAIPELSSSESTTRKRRGRGNNGNRGQPKSPKDVKAETKQRTRKGKSEEFKGSTGWARFSPFRFFSMIFIWFVNCVAGSNENPVENFGDACFRIFINPFATMFAGLWGNSPRLQNRAVLLSGSAIIAFGIFLMLVFLGGAFSESITIPVDSIHEFPRHSNPNFEANMLNT